MHILKLLPVLAVMALPSFSAEAREPAREVFLATAKTEGFADGGEQRSYFLKVPSARTITFDIVADNDLCRYEIKKASQLGYLSTSGRFPAKHSDRAEEGEVYTLSLYQSRSGWIAKNACHFSFSVD